MQIIAGPSLRSRTTLRMGGRAQAEVCIETARDWDACSEFLDREGLPPLVLGRGSNLLVRDGELPLCLVRPGGTKPPEVVSHSNNRAVVRVQAGYSLPRLLSWLRGLGLAGLEGLTGIPGQVGGAVAMNAGSFGQCMGDCLHRVRCWAPETGLMWLDFRDVECGYRSFRPLGLGRGWVIHELELGLDRADPAEIKGRMREFFHTKRSTQPVGRATCGCTFQNPETAPAGLLLDRCGLRGKRIGDVGFSSVHANFLINWGRGSYVQAKELIAEAQDRVRAGFGQELQLEVKIVDPYGDTP